MNLDPKFMFEMIADAVPTELHPNLLVAGSIAAAYHHRENLGSQGIATKDADVIVQPVGAIDECRKIAMRLLADGWRRTEECYPKARTEPDLRAIRLNPKHTDAFFIELLGLPEPTQKESRRWVPCELPDGWYAVPTFRYMALVGSDRRRSEVGIEYASPPLMALSNLLSHPVLGTDVIKKPIVGRSILRSAKDLGRVIALAWLEGGNFDEEWLPIWSSALARHFPDEAKALGARCGDGLRALLADDSAMEQAHHTTSVGLLRGKNVDIEALRVTGQRVLQFVVDPLAETP
jgi:hypothetical protein